MWNYFFPNQKKNCGKCDVHRNWAKNLICEVYDIVEQHDLSGNWYGIDKIVVIPNNMHNRKYQMPCDSDGQLLDNPRSKGANENRDSVADS